MDVLKLGKAKYELPKPPESLSKPPEPASLEPSRAGEVLRIDSIINEPQTSDQRSKGDVGKLNQRAPQIDEDGKLEQCDELIESVAIIPKTVEETRYCLY